MAQGSSDMETTDQEESSPNMIVYRKIEDIITRMQDDKAGGVPIRTVKSFLSKIPSVVTGADIVQWLMKNLSIEDPAEAIHMGSLIAAQGYIFPISDHVLTLKDDGTFYRFQITFLNVQIDRHCLKMSKVAESLITYSEQYLEYDPFITPAEPSNPWINDDTVFWDLEISKEPSQHRVKRWGFSIDEVLKDPVGRDQFLRFLESEFSSENLRFWLAVQDLKKQPLQDVATRVEDIWQEFLAPGAQSAINLDSHSYEITSQNVKDPGRYTYEDAQEHIYKLMKSDSYARFLRSNAYQDLLLAKKKPENEQGRRTSLEKGSHWQASASQV
ncbi:Regulator of G-protein signaling 6 [Varanus komodoensis]|nr:Regulator of G-protein signaling 6 [Varanus komodoensis]